MPPDRIQDRAKGRWRDILRAVGFTDKNLNGHHGPCPMCGGRDRWRFDDREGAGSFFCSHCGAGGGVDLVMKFLKCDFITAKGEIEKHIGAASVSMPKAAPAEGDALSRMIESWRRASPLTGLDAASRWLERRGVAPLMLPSQLRFASEAAYLHDDKRKSFHPAMVAKFVSPDAQGFTLHRTYLSLDGFKADVPEVRKLAPGKVPDGGAVRLAASAERMGVSTGIETSLAAMAMFRLPVWATLNDRLLLKWKPPSTVRHLVIFGDNDVSYSGQMVSFGLAYRLKGEGLDVEVRIPDAQGDDWNAVRMRDMGIEPPVKREAKRDEYADSDVFAD